MSEDKPNTEDIDAEIPSGSRIGIRLDVLGDIINDLNKDLELQSMFGNPVARNLVIVADKDDLRIEESGNVKLDDAQVKRFIEILKRVIEANTL